MMKKILWFLSLLGLVSLGWLPSASKAQIPTLDLLASQDGLVSMRVPSDWYLAVEQNDSQVHLLAATTPEDSLELGANTGLMVNIYVDSTDNSPALFAKTLKDHGLNGIDLTETPFNILGLSATRYSGQNADRQVDLLWLNIPETDFWVRWVATASPANWDSGLVQANLESLTLLPQIAKTPRGWLASLRAPLGWEQDTFSSFVQWLAPSDSPFAGLEIWFQAGFRTELVGEGDIRLALQSLGVTYSSQVDQSLAYEAVLGGLPATVQPFESFTHAGLAYYADGSAEVGTAHIIARAPLGKWTPQHQQLVEAIAASVQILPPTPDAAAVGLTQGYRPPNFEARFLDGSSFSLSDYEGQLVFLHFWFVNCPSCQAEWPHLQTVYNDYKDQGLVLLAVNALDPVTYIDSYMESEQLDFPLVLDNGQIHDLYAVRLFPSTFVIAPNGVIIHTARGMLSERSMRNLIEQNLPN